MLHSLPMPSSHHLQHGSRPAPQTRWIVHVHVAWVTTWCLSKRTMMTLSSVCCTYMSHLYLVSFKAGIIQTSTKLNLLFRTRAWPFFQFDGDISFLCKSNVDVDITSRRTTQNVVWTTNCTKNVLAAHILLRVFHVNQSQFGGKMQQSSSFYYGLFVEMAEKKVRKTLVILSFCDHEGVYLTSLKNNCTNFVAHKEKDEASHSLLLFFY